MQFTSPRGVDVDTGGNVYVTEPETQRVRKITAQVSCLRISYFPWTDLSTFSKLMHDCGRQALV